MSVDYTFSIPQSPFAVAIGKFDGFHKGHQRIIQSMLDEAPAIKHMAFIICKDAVSLSTACEREALARKYGADVVFVQDMNEEFMSTEAEDFIGKLCGGGNLRLICTGRDFRFGRNAAGDAALLERLSDIYGFRSVCAEPVKNDCGERISSTLIRTALLKGDVHASGRMLGRAYTLSGRVMYGRQLGRTIGFPTLNIAPPAQRVLPEAGVYAGVCEVCGGLYKCAVNIGANPTVGAKETVIEANLHGFSSQAYGEQITLHLLRRIRDEKCFATLAKLQEQLHADSEEALSALCSIESIRDMEEIFAG